MCGYYDIEIANFISFPYTIQLHKWDWLRFTRICQIFKSGCCVFLVFSCFVFAFGFFSLSLLMWPQESFSPNLCLWQRYPLRGLRVYEKQLNPTELPIKIEYSLKHFGKTSLEKKSPVSPALGQGERHPRSRNLFYLTQIICIPLASLATLVVPPPFEILISELPPLWNPSAGSCTCGWILRFRNSGMERKNEFSRGGNLLKKPFSWCQHSQAASQLCQPSSAQAALALGRWIPHQHQRQDRNTSIPISIFHCSSLNKPLQQD